MSPKQSPGGEAKKPGSGEAKSKPGDPKGGQPGDAQGKPGDPKEGQKSDSKGQGEGKGDAKSDGKGQGQPSSGKSGQGSQQAGGSKSGGKQPSKPNDQQQDQDFPGKKQIQQGNEHQRKAEDEIDKGDNERATDQQAKAVEELKKARKQLEELLRQLRAEEIERILAALQNRCERMLAMQIEVRKDTVNLDKNIKARIEQKPDNSDQQRGYALSDDEEKIIKEANDALRLLESEGSSVAFPVVLDYARDMMVTVARRLRSTDTGTITVGTEQEIIDSLQEMIEALKKERKNNQQKQQSPPGSSSQPQNQPLLEEVQELKMIRNMQLRVNRQTELSGKEYPGEQAPAIEKAPTPQEREKAEMLLREHKNLSDKQVKIYEVTNNLYRGKNK